MTRDQSPEKPFPGGRAGQWRGLVVLGGMLLAALGCRLGGGSPTPQAAPTSLTPPTYTAETAVPTQPLPVEAQPSARPLPEAGDLQAVYVKDGDLWTWRQGQAVQLTHDDQVYRPSFSPDGQVIAFLRLVDDVHLELWAIDRSGANERRLVSVADLDKIGASERAAGALAINPSHFAWLPGSHTLGFNSCQVFQGPSPARLNDFNLVNADTQALSLALLAGWGGEFVFAPDGSQVAISTPTALILSSLDGGSYRSVLSFEQIITYSEYLYAPLPVWAPDGQSLWVAIPPVDVLAKADQPTALWRIPTGKEALSQQVGSVTAVPFFDALVSSAPDLSRLAYLQESGSPEQMRRALYLAQVDGSASRLYQEGERLQFHGWAVDGEHFFFSLGADQALYLGAPDAEPVRLGEHPYGLLEVHWLGAGRYIFLRQRTGAQPAEEGFDLRLGLMGGGEILLDSFSELRGYDVYP